MRHPVVRLDFSGANFHEPDALCDDVAAQLDAIEFSKEARNLPPRLRWNAPELA